jgi:ATP-dependent DNA ligase
MLESRHSTPASCEGIVSKRLGSRYRSGRSPDWLKFKNPNAPAVRREAEIAAQQVVGRVSLFSSSPAGTP